MQFHLSKENTMFSRKIVSLFACALLGLWASGTAFAQCPTGTWSASPPNPQVNQRHIFCGEIGGNGRPKGYHSKVYPPPVDVVLNTQNETAPVNGVYDGRVNFNNGTHKFSTFFPDHCTQAEIVASVRYASANPLHPQPNGPWGSVGPSAAGAHAAGHCLGNDGNPIMVRHADVNNNRINTAFPYQAPPAPMAMKKKTQPAASTPTPDQVVTDFLVTDIRRDRNHCQAVLDLLTGPGSQGDSIGNLYRLSLNGTNAVLENIHDDTMKSVTLPRTQLLARVRAWCKL
jgi:hypothetical protein